MPPMDVVEFAVHGPSVKGTRYSGPLRDGLRPLGWRFMPVMPQDPAQIRQGYAVRTQANLAQRDKHVAPVLKRPLLAFPTPKRVSGHLNDRIRRSAEQRPGLG